MVLGFFLSTILLKGQAYKGQKGQVNEPPHHPITPSPHYLITSSREIK